MQTIPAEWLYQATTRGEVEEQLADELMPDVWLEEWRRFLSRIGPGDELWEFSAMVVEEPEAASEGGSEDWHEGYAIVRDREVVDSIDLPWH